MQLQDLNALTTTDLENLSVRVAAILKSRIENERAETIEKIKSLADRVGLSVSFQDARGAGSKSSGAAARYRNPENERDTWSGRGRAPKWLVELEASGRERSEFLIAKP